MTDEAILSILDRLNSGEHEDIIISPIGRDVWWGFVWGKAENGYMPEGCIQEKGFEFFFVRAGDSKFAAAVFRMGPDELHWYVAAPYRRRGILVKPLRKTILPFVFKVHGEDQQEANVDTGPNATYSTKLARKAGFRRIASREGKRKFVIKRKNLAEFLPLLEQPRLNESELGEMDRRVNKLRRSARMILDLLRVKHSDPLVPGGLDSVIDEVECATFALKGFVSHELEMAVERRRTRAGVRHGAKRKRGRD